MRTSTGVRRIQDGLQVQHTGFLARCWPEQLSLVLGGRFSPDAWYSAIEEYGVTVWYSAPTALEC